MTLLPLIFLFLIVGILPLAADSNIKLEYVAGTGMEIHTNPQGARVFIDGVERGVTPFFLSDMIAETYNVVLRKETYADREFKAVIFNNSRLVVTMDIEIALGYVDINVLKEEDSPASLPFHPQVSARAADKTITSISLSNNNTASTRLPIGNQTIQARAFGWEDASVTVLISGQNITFTEIVMKPAAFTMTNTSQSRRRFNPLNSSNLGVTEFRFEVSSPGTGTVKILDSEENIVYTKHLDQFNTWIQHVTWDGSDSEGNLLPQGYYTVLIETMGLPQFAQDEDENETHLKRLRTEINYSLNIFPLSLESGIAGLAFAPMPHVLPAGSYQINAGLLFGNFWLPLGANDGSYAFGFPFKINMRFAPLERMELTTVFNINPYIEHNAGWGLSGSVKYNFFDGSGSVPLAFAAGASYAWASKTGDSQLSPGKGAGIYTPLSLEISSFSLVLCPAAFWHGPEGIAPDLLLSAGVHYHGSWLTSGISARYEFGFKEDNEARFLTGAEINLFPPPSNIVFLIQGGIWIKSSNLGGYGGVGIGFIY